MLSDIGCEDRSCGLFFVDDVENLLRGNGIARKACRFRRKCGFVLFQIFYQIDPFGVTGFGEF